MDLAGSYTFWFGRCRIDASMIDQTLGRLITGLVLLAAFEAASTTPVAVIGHVVALDGLWCDTSRFDCSAVSSSNVMGALYPVRFTSRLVRLRSISGNEWIRIRSDVSGNLLQFDCSTVVDCTKPLDLERLKLLANETSGAAGILGDLLSAVRMLATEKPALYERYRQALLRGMNMDLRINDTVSLLDSDGLHLENSFSGLPAGTLFIELCRINREGVVLATPEPHPLRYQWNPKKPQALRSNISVGLYRIYMCQNSTSGFLRSDSYADVLVERSPKFKHLKADLDQLDSVVKTEADSDPTLRSMLKIYLYNLAFPLEKPRAERKQSGSSLSESASNRSD